MPNKHKHRVSISQMTDNGGYVYGGFNEYRGIAIFSATYNQCEFNDIRLVKVKTGDKIGNYSDPDSGEYFRVSKYEKIQ